MPNARQPPPRRRLSNGLTNSQNDLLEAEREKKNASKRALFKNEGGRDNDAIEELSREGGDIKSLSKRSRGSRRSKKSR